VPGAPPKPRLSVVPDPPEPASGASAEADTPERATDAPAAAAQDAAAPASAERAATPSEHTPSPSPSEPSDGRPVADGDAAGEPAPASSGGDVQAVRAALDAVLPELRAPAKAACKDGEFVGFDGTNATFELATGVPLRHAERFRADIERALTAQLGASVTLQLVPHGDGEPSPSAPRISGGAVDLAEAEELVTIDIAELEDADDVAETGIERLTRAFPGAVVMTQDEVNP
jgi:hypothetical protein